jgi:hypothetical protein
MKQRKVDRKGVYVFPCGGTYVGGWSKGLAHGKGAWTHPDGCRYVGKLKNGSFHGHGTLTYGDGSVYVGNFEDCEPEGQGTLTHPSGRSQVGEWSRGELTEGIQYDAEGKAEFVYTGGSIRTPRRNNVYALKKAPSRLAVCPMHRAYSVT